MTAEDYPQAAALVTEECHRALTAIEPEKVLEVVRLCFRQESQERPKHLGQKSFI